MEVKFAESEVVSNVGAYTWAIKGVSHISDRVGDITESPEFTICGHTWQLRIFLGGSLEMHHGFMSFYLASKSTIITNAMYKLMVLAQVDSEVDEVFTSSGVRQFEARGKQVDGWGRDKFISIENLKSSINGFYLRDTIICSVEIRVMSDTQYEVKPYALDDYATQMLSMATGPLSDISIECTGGDTTATLTANKCILAARSPVLCAMLTNGMKESHQSCITLPDDYLVMKEVLYYIYTNSCSKYQDTDFVKDLLAVSSKYQIQGLVSICEARLCLAINNDNCISLLFYADTLFAESLKRNALQYIARNIDRIKSDAEYSLVCAVFKLELAEMKKSISRRFTLKDVSLLSIKSGISKCSIS